MKKIFVNLELDQMRSGWKILVFIILFSLGASGIQIGFKAIEAAWHMRIFFVIPEIFIYGVLFVETILWLKFYEKRPMWSVGLHVDKVFGLDLLKGVIIGGAMMIAIFTIEWGAGFVQLSYKQLSAGVMLQLTAVSGAIFILGAFGEEMLFRGYMFQVLVEGTNKIIAVVIFAVFFGMAHLSNPHVTFFSFINVVLAGIWLSLAYLKTRSLALPLGLHFSWNFLQNHVFSFPVSGIDFTQFQLGTLVQSGPEWLTGGHFGPEGGALATVMVLASTVLIYYSSWFYPSERAWRYERWIRERKEQVTQQKMALQSDSTQSM